MGDVVELYQTLKRGGEPPDNGAMEARVARLEQQVEKANERLAGIDVRLAGMEAKMDQFATKADLHKAINEQTWKLVTFVCGFGSALVAATYFLAKHFGS